MAEDSAEIEPFDGRGLPHENVLDADGGFWVFGYGSLMWRPGFRFVGRRHARLPGYARRFCLESVCYRGTPDAPGLVLALDADAQAATRGVAYRVAAEDARAVHAYLIERELVTAAYREALAPIRFCDGDEETVTALTYIIDKGHCQYAGDLSLERQAEIIASCAGASGPNCEYLFNTLEHMRESGMTELELDRLDVLERLVRARLGEPAP